MSQLPVKELPKRFYQSAMAVEGEGGWQILLDGKPVRTPARHLLAVPAQELAEVIAGEWDAQQTHIDKNRMPLTALACIALDVARDKADAMREELASYAETDQLCYRDPDALTQAEQVRLYDPLLGWAGEALRAKLHVTTEILPLPQSPEALVALKEEIERLDAWQLAAASLGCGITRSLVVALALLKRRINAEEALVLASLEESLQAKAWGMDPVTQARLENWKRDLTAIEIFVAALA